MKKFSVVSLVALLILVGSFAGYRVAQAAAGEGTATISDTTGTPGAESASAGVTAERGVSDVFTVILTVGTSGMINGASSPTFTVPTGFTAPHANGGAAVPTNAGQVDVDGEWFAVAGGCTVTMGSSGASGQVITVDVTADCAVGNTITLTYKGKSAVTTAAKAFEVRTADGAPAAALIGVDGPSPTITVADTIPPTVVVTMSDAALTVGETALVTFTFSEAPVGFTTADVTVGNGTIGAIDSSNPLIQTATYTPTSGVASVTNVITVGTAWTDAALNAGVGGSSPNYTIDTVVPPSGGMPQIGTITVVKNVINDNGGTKTVADFPLFVNGMQVVSGVTNNFPAPASAYTITETSNSNYTQTFSGACDSNGRLNLNPGDLKVCVITNDDKGAPAIPLTPPLIDVVKVPSPLALPNGPGPVTYTYTLKNIGTVPVTNVTMVGDTCSPIILSSGDMNSNAILETNETWVYHCTTTLSATHTNTVTATGWANGISAVDVASATVVVGTSAVPPLIHVTKIPSPLSLPAGGGTIIYLEKINNPGTVALSNVTLTDDKCSPMKYISGDTNNDKKLDTTETWLYSCASNLTKSTTNTATATGDANGLTATDFAVATVLVAAPGLPNTGLPPSSWSIVLLVGICTVLAVYFYRRKQKVNSI